MIALSLRLDRTVVALGKFISSLHNIHAQDKAAIF